MRLYVENRRFMSSNIHVSDHVYKKLICGKLRYDENPLVNQRHLLVVHVARQVLYFTKYALTGEVLKHNEDY